jgi:hypothetical protein
MVTYYVPARSAEVQSINTYTRGLDPKVAGGIEMPPLKLVWYDGGLRPPRPEDLPKGARMDENGRMLVGDHGFILGNTVWPEARRREIGPVPKVIERSPGHYLEWAIACKGGKASGSNFDVAGPLAEAVLLGNVALRVQLREELTRMKLDWDPVGLQVANLPEAAPFVRREYREGWSL